MWRRIKQILLPGIIIALVVIAGGLILNATLRQSYQSAARRETAALVGAIAEAYPDLDRATIVKALSGATNSGTTALGEDIMLQFGIYGQDLARLSAENFSQHSNYLIIIAVTVISFSLLTYFWWRDWRDERQVIELVDYLQKLKDRIYELKLDENTEEKFSLLTNEIYKITVLLKENAERNLKQRKSLETALADISHQLRTPLTSLQILIDNIYDDPDMPAKVRQDFLRSASRQIDGMSNLVMTLLNLTKFDSGSIVLHQLPVKVGELLAEVHQKIAVLAELHDIQINLSGDLGAEIKIDRRWQAEALTNVVKNCVEHSPDGSEIDVRVTNSPVFLKIAIADHGEGIAPSDQRHIFERFYRAKNAAAGSIGIGLAFAKTVILANNGQISVTSKEGQGTTFTIKYFK